jgi:hypothetical protein
MNAVNQAHLLASQLLAHNLEDVKVTSIKDALERVKREDHTLSILLAECLRIAKDEGCTEMYQGARSMLWAYCYSMELNGVGVMAALNRAIDEMYMGVAA